MNKRHNLDPESVSKQIQKKVDEFKLKMEDSLQKEKEIHILYKEAKKKGTHTKWLKPRTDLDADLKEITSIYEQMIKKQQDYYSTVRIIELNQSDKHFVLVYGNQEDSQVTEGTGPFESIEKSIAWFINGGR